ncbi:MAG: ABC transporter ATP-binding protein [Methanobacteriota archaeon]|nr:MAG: ABC transporter ATP-binding protein [Euryarchaeota archaeon]
MKEKMQRPSLLGFLWIYITPYKKLFWGTVALLVLSIAISTVAPIAFQRGFSQLVESHSGYIEAQAILLPLVVYFTLLLTQWGVQILREVVIVNFNSRVIKDMRTDIFNTIVHNKVSFFDNQESGVLSSAVTNDVQEMYDAGLNFAHVLTSIIQLFAIIFVLWKYSPRLTVVSILFFPTFFVIAFALRKYQRKVEKVWRRNFASVNQKFNESLRAIVVSKAFGREKKNIESFREVNEATYRASIKRAFAIFIISPINDFLRHISLLVIIFFGAQEVLAGNVELAEFYIFIFVIDYFYEPALGLARNYSRFQTLFGNLDRVLKLTSEGRFKENEIGNNTNKQIEGKVEFRSVNFSYIENEPILHDVSFNVHVGEKIAIVGHTGAGKTTIATLLLRFYEVKSGEILIDDIPIEDYDLYNLRKQVFMVSQKVFIFEGTLRENLTIAKPNATDEEILRALEAVQAMEFIRLLPDGLDTYITAGGGNLSAGQRQMISFARALLANPKIIILDEATSVVDLYTEAKIQEATDELLKGRTAIVIAHRLTTILNADRIVVLEKGKVVQKGTHEELIRQTGPYAEMYDLYFRTQSAKYLEQIKMKN